MQNGIFKKKWVITFRQINMTINHEKKIKIPLLFQSLLFPFFRILLSAFYIFFKFSLANALINYELVLAVSDID